MKTEKPDWEELVKIKRPENGLWKGCSNQGEMIGYALAVVQLKKKLLERIEKCNDNLSTFPTEPISLAVKRELEAILSDYYDLPRTPSLTATTKSKQMKPTREQLSKLKDLLFWSFGMKFSILSMVVL